MANMHEIKMKGTAMKTSIERLPHRDGGYGGWGTIRRDQSPASRWINGFTLIELLIVIAIIAILAAILFPVFATAREKARQTTCSSNLKQLGLAMVQYTQDYDECPPNGSSKTWSVWGWAGQIYPYVKSKAAYVCPDDLTPGASVSYLYNRNIQNENGSIIQGTTGFGTYPLSRYGSTARTVILCEITGSAGYDVSDQNPHDVQSDFYSTWQEGGYSPDGYGGIGAPADPDGLTYGTTSVPCNQSTNEATPICPSGFTIKYATGYPSDYESGWSTAILFTGPTGRHSGGSNYLMMDGHVKWLMGSQVSAGYNDSTQGSCAQMSWMAAANTSCSQPGASVTWSIY